MIQRLSGQQYGLAQTVWWGWGKGGAMDQYKAGSPMESTKGQCLPLSVPDSAHCQGKTDGKTR